VGRHTVASLGLELTISLASKHRNTQLKRLGHPIALLGLVSAALVIMLALAHLLHALAKFSIAHCFGRAAAHVTRVMKVAARGEVTVISEALPKKRRNRAAVGVGTDQFLGYRVQVAGATMLRTFATARLAHSTTAATATTEQRPQVSEIKLLLCIGRKSGE